MRKKYIVKNCEDSKFYKGVPYITKKEFKKIDDKVIIGKTRLKKYKSNSDKELDLLCFNNEKYEIRNRIFGFKKGYIWVGKNNYIVLKTCIPFFILLFLLILLLLCLSFKLDKGRENRPIDNNQSEVVIIDDNQEETNCSDKILEENTNNYDSKEDKQKEIKEIEHLIIFDANGGKGTMDSFVCKGKERCILPKNILTKEGYKFKGWSTQKDGNPIYLDNMEFSDSFNKNDAKIVLYAIWQIMKFDVEFIDYDGTIIYTAEFNYGDNLFMPNDPEREGYTFLKWDNEVNKVKENLKITALYTINNYDISYNLNGGEFEEDIPLKFTIKDDSFKIPNPTKEGYIFIGWTGTDLASPTKDLIIERGTTGDKKLTANYKPISYNIVYNSSDSEETMENTKIEYDTKAKLSKNIFTKEGYTFKGWSTELNGKILYVDEAEIYNLSNIDNDVINLYANWEIIRLNVKYYDLFGTLLKEETVNYGDKSIAPEDPFADGYTFIGWDSSNDLIKEDTVFRAKYSVDIYNIQCNLNKGSDELIEIPYNIESKEFTLQTPTRVGYTFIGWTGDNGSEPTLEVTIPKGTIGNLNYQANWKANNYKVSLNANKGSVSPDFINVLYDSNYGIIPEPSRTGYSFDGWYYDNSLIKDSTVMKNAFDHQLDAKWTAIDYDISYNLDGGKFEEDVPLRFTIEDDSIIIPNPTKTGYTFIGWTGTDLTVSTKDLIIDTETIGNKTYKAMWEKNYYTVNYYVNGNLWKQRTVGYNDTLENLDAQSTLDGYHTFHGWNGWVATMPARNVNLYADITEAYCKLITGHAPDNNAWGLLTVFQQAGWTGRVIEAPGFPGNYLAETDYSLTRAQAEVQKNYIASHTNYANYEIPYLYWVAIECTNGYRGNWARNGGNMNFSEV